MKQYGENSGITLQGRASSLYDRRRLPDFNRHDVRLCMLSVRLMNSRMSATEIYLAMHVFSRNVVPFLTNQQPKRAWRVMFSMPWQPG